MLGQSIKLQFGTDWFTLPLSHKAYLEANEWLAALVNIHFSVKDIYLCSWSLHSCYPHYYPRLHYAFCKKIVLYNIIADRLNDLISCFLASYHLCLLFYFSLLYFVAFTFLYDFFCIPLFHFSLSLFRIIFPFPLHCLPIPPFLTIHILFHSPHIFIHPTSYFPHIVCTLPTPYHVPLPLSYSCCPHAPLQWNLPVDPQAAVDLLPPATVPEWDQCRKCLHHQQQPALLSQHSKLDPPVSNWQPEGFDTQQPWPKGM